jgi:phosphotransferase system enzyme I (PtsI)
VEIQRSSIQNVEEELRKLQSALNCVIEETEESIKKLEEQENNDQLQIMQAYLMILQDETLIEKAKVMIKQEKSDSVYATKKGLDEIIANFQNIDNEYLAERAKDIEDIKNRIIGKLLNKQETKLGNLEPNTIIVTEELTTSEISNINLKNVTGIISKIGGANSHVSIIARNKQIPMIIRVENVIDIIKNDDIVIINGETGEIYINPSIEEMEKYKEQQKTEQENKRRLEEYKNKLAKTKDGYQVEISCNIGKPSDLEDAINVGADGIGLFRTEFLFMDSKQMPSEEEQFESYKQIADTMKDKLSIIRTLDAGGDKDIPYLNLEREENPFLGHRAIRLCLDNVEMFKMQLRAILRASYYGNLAIMFPMISTIEEIRKAKGILEECKKELDTQDIKYNPNIKIGMMIEIPAAALMAESFAKECDFFSIGTNDLIQYTIAAERGNTKIANLYTKNHPAVIKLIKQTIDAAHNNGIFCGMCGEAASNIHYVPLLIGLGLDEFSMNSSAILETKKIITKLEKKNCEELVEKVLNAVSDKDVEKILKEFKY